MIVETDILKNFFNTTTNSFKRFSFRNAEYSWSRSKIDGESYTCMKHGKTVRIFNSVLNPDEFYIDEPLVEFTI
jgi:hypothetical protein